MKFLIVFSVIAAVASAGVVKPSIVSDAVAEIQEVIAAINSPSTDPATAAALEQMLYETLGISSGAQVTEDTAPISVGPAIIGFPLPDGGAVTAEEPAIVESPVVVDTPIVDVSPAAVEAAAPLVQIILNINKASDVAASPVAPAPVETPVVEAHPVNIVDEAVNAETIVPTPVLVVEASPEPVQVVEVAPVPVQVVESAPESIQIAEVAPVVIPAPVLPEPIVIPAPVVTLPETLN